MKEIDLQQKTSEIERYLYFEMPNAERERFEERFFDDDEFFYSVVDLENELVDRYASGKLGAAERARFERSLENAPERRAKIANAAALQTFIAEERPPEKIAVAVEERQTFGQKLAQMFSLKTPAFASAMAGLLFIFAISTVFLLLENRRKADELAGLQNERQAEIFGRREKDLQNQLAGAQTRETELKNQIDRERAASGDLTDELEREKRRREAIEAEIERLRRENSARPAQTPTPQQSAPIVASILLVPNIKTRDGGVISQTVSIERGTKRVAVRLALPDGVKAGERFSVALNEKIVAENLAVLASSSGAAQKAIQLTVSPNDLLDGANKFVVRDAAGAQLTEFVFNALKK